jgi:hypothetical protein
MDWTRVPPVVYSSRKSGLAALLKATVPLPTRSTNRLPLVNGFCANAGSGAKDAKKRNNLIRLMNE